MNLAILIEKFTSHSSCLSYLEKVRWPQGPVCPYCSSKRSSAVSKENRYKCCKCNRSFSVLVGTIFEATKLPLQKWFMAIYLIMDAKKGISSLQLSRHLNINKDTAWLLQRRIRIAMSESNFLQGIVEVDETYIGGSLSKMNIDYKKRGNHYKQGQEHKQPVLGMYQREGKIKLKILEKAWGEEIKPILKESISKESTIVTDGFGGYYGIDKYYNAHIVLNHTKKINRIGEYNTSSIEGFWSMLKRSVIGTYHQISLKYLQEYLDELAFKFNYRNNHKRFDIIINNLLNRTFPLSG